MNSKIYQMCPFLHLKRFKVPIPLLPEFLLSSLQALVVSSAVTIYPGIYVLINQKLGLMAYKYMNKKLGKSYDKICKLN